MTKPGLTYTVFLLSLLTCKHNRMPYFWLCWNCQL